MIRGLVLFYLNNKPTHGYEIQKYVQISGIEQWTKIQSGSIYYALNKLEKEKFIEVLKEERTGSRIRKIYQITKSGKKELEKEIALILDTPIAVVGSPKFVAVILMNVLEDGKIGQIVQRHINGLVEQAAYWEKWQRIKGGSGTSKLNQMSFQMAIDSLHAQIEWHEELLKNKKKYLEESKAMEKIIHTFDVEQIEKLEKTEDVAKKLDYLEELKKMIVQDPNNAVSNLDKMMELLKEQE